jgi:ketosteroid isomerase-like protein
MSEFVEAESAVRQLHARYIDAVWRKDAEAYGDCWGESAEWKIIGSELRGRAAIVAFFVNIMQNFDRVIQFYHPPILEIAAGGTTGTGRTYVTEHNCLKNGKRAFTIGQYHEKYRNEGKRWRFTWRHFDLFYMGPPDLSAPFFEIPDYGAPPRLPDPGRPASPPAYRIAM